MENNCLFITGDDLDKMKLIYGITYSNMFELLKIEYISVFWCTGLVEIYDNDYRVKKSFKKVWPNKWSFTKNREPLTFKIQKLILISKDYYGNKR